ncbi:MAG: hypothetical protein ACYCU0_03315 [Solirubrobacteraceae bacterium]
MTTPIADRRVKPLLALPAWMSDGAHPAAAGCARGRLVIDAGWAEWLGSAGGAKESP